MSYANSVKLLTAIHSGIGVSHDTFPDVDAGVLNQWRGETWQYNTLADEAQARKCLDVDPLFEELDGNTRPPVRDTLAYALAQEHRAKLANPKNLPLQAPTMRLVDGYWVPITSEVQ